MISSHVAVTTVQQQIDFGLSAGFITLANESATQTIYIGLGTSNDIIIGDGIPLRAGSVFIFEKRGESGGFGFVKVISTGSANLALQYGI